MVLRWGMSDKSGNIDYSEAHDGYSGSTAGLSVSANTKELIEGEVKRFIAEAYDTAFAILSDKTVEWERLAQGLLEYETLTGDEIKRVMKGVPPQAGPDDEGSDSAGTGASITAIPKTKPRLKPVDDSGLEPEPSV